MPAAHVRKCPCGAKFDTLSWRGDEWSIASEDDDLRLFCPTCGNAEADSFVDATVWGGGGLGLLGGEASVGREFPYYDRSLRCQVNSYAHRKQLMKERNLVEADIDHTIREEAKARRASDQARANDRAYRKQLEEDPAYADFRKLADAGAYDTVLPDGRRIGPYRYKEPT